MRYRANPLQIGYAYDQASGNTKTRSPRLG